MRLHEQRDTMRRHLEHMHDELLELVTWLGTDKFKAPDDWVRTWEVIERVRVLRTEVAEALEQTHGLSEANGANHASIH